MQVLLKLLWVAVAIYAALGLSVFLFQNHLVFAPSSNVGRDPSAMNLSFEDVYLPSSAGIRVHGWFVPHDRARYTLLFCHGNAGNISDRVELIHLLHSLGLNVFIFDYAGYGNSNGKPSEQQTYHDGRAAWQFLIKSKKIKPSEVVVLGRSLGGGIATQLAMESSPAALVLESTFTSIPDMGAHLYPWLPVRWLSRIGYHNIERIMHLEMPLLITHGPADEVIPYAHSRALLEASSAKTWHRDLGGSHNDAYLVDAPGYMKNWREFLEQLPGG